MWNRIGTVATLLLVTCILAILLYPVGGEVWSAGQVSRLAQVDGDLRSETGSEAAIGEAVAGVRVDRLKRFLSSVTGEECHPRQLEFLTVAGWVPATVQCPDGFFLDFVPTPIQPSHP